MDMIAFTPFVVLGALIFVTLLILHRVEKKEREESQKELQAYLHRWQIESDKNDKNTQRILDDLKEISKENSLFLRMIFEHVDKPPMGLE